MAAKPKKPGMLKRLFSSKKLDVSEISEADKKKYQRSKSMDASMMRQRAASETDDPPKADKKLKEKKGSVSGASGSKARVAAAKVHKAPPKDGQNGQKPKTREKGLSRDNNDSLKRRQKKKKAPIHVSLGDKIDYPCPPEIIQEHHKLNPFLNSTEEWLIVELGEFECLIENLDMIKIMAKHSKFFEVEPDELVEEFFEFVDDVPSYDEVVNYDVWQEFRDKKYLC